MNINHLLKKKKKYFDWISTPFLYCSKICFPPYHLDYEAWRMQIFNSEISHWILTRLLLLEGEYSTLQLGMIRMSLCV